jgi:hypothetical protein
MYVKPRKEYKSYVSFITIRNLLQLILMGQILFVTLEYLQWAASVVLWSEFLATDPEVPGSIPGATRFSEK